MDPLDLIGYISKHYGVTHFNAAMVVVLASLLYRWFKSLIRSIEKQGVALLDVATDIKLGRQWQAFHEVEDTRRFDELNRRIGDRRGP